MSRSAAQARGTRSWGASLSITIIAALVVLIAACGDEDGGQSNSSNEITIGALLDLSGSWQTLGKASEATLQIGVQELNDNLQSQGRKERVRLIVEDTGLDPDQALARLKSLADRGARIVIGPQSSAEVSALKGYADSNGIVLISQGSTASSLSLQGDNVFRLTPDDRREGEAVTAMMLEDGKTTVLPVCREDAGNRGLCDSVTQELQKYGAKVLPRVTYRGTAPAEDILRNLKANFGGQQGPSVAIYLAAFEEAVGLFKAAASDEVLQSIDWYGSDGMALNAQLVDPSNAQSARFAVEVSYPNPIFALDAESQEDWQPLFDRVKAKVGYDPDAFALSAYDALVIAVNAYLEAGGTADLRAYKERLVQIAGANDSLSGSTELNDAGDRKSGVFDFWAVESTGSGSYRWERVATYRPSGDGSGTITRYDR